MRKENFGKNTKGQEVFLYTFENEQKMKMTVSNIGAVLTNLWIPDKDGNLRDVVWVMIQLLIMKIMETPILERLSDVTQIALKMLDSDYMIKFTDWQRTMVRTIYTVDPMAMN